jgi:hypothetical protein
MSDLLNRIMALVKAGDFRVSNHGDEELAADSISMRDVVARICEATVVTEYPEYNKGP